MANLILLLAAVILAGLATFNVGGPRFNLLAAAVLCYLLTLLLPAIGANG